MDQLFTDLEGRFDRKLRLMENLIQLQVAVDLILTCSNKDEEKTNKVVHRLVQIFGLVEKFVIVKLTIFIILECEKM